MPLSKFSARNEYLNLGRDFFCCSCECQKSMLEAENSHMLPCTEGIAPSDSLRQVPSTLFYDGRLIAAADEIAVSSLLEAGYCFLPSFLFGGK
jgi:hypothetical protein